MKKDIMERKGWTDIGSDVNWQDHGGKWAKPDPNNHWVWWVIRHEINEDHEGYGNKYYSDLSRVDFGEVSQDDIKRAMDCCGLTSGDISEDNPFVLVYALHSYGIYAPMGEVSSNYPERPRAEMRRLADELMVDSEQCEDRLNRSVNKIGSTARDFQAGDCLAGLKRYEENGEHGTDPAKDLMLKIYGGSVVNR